MTSLESRSTRSDILRLRVKFLNYSQNACVLLLVRVGVLSGRVELLGNALGGGLGGNSCGLGLLLGLDSLYGDGDLLRLSYPFASQAASSQQP